MRPVGPERHRSCSTSRPREANNGELSLALPLPFYEVGKMEENNLRYKTLGQGKKKKRQER